MNKQVIFEARFRTAQDLVNKLSQVDLTDMYVRGIDGAPAFQNLQVIEETLTDGSKVCDVILS